MSGLSIPKILLIIVIVMVLPLLLTGVRHKITRRDFYETIKIKI